MPHLLTFVPVALLAVALIAPAGGQERSPAAQAPSFAKSTDDSQWTMPGKDLAATRYSALDEITAENVKDLKVDVTFSLGVNRGQEAAPLVIGEKLYVVAPFPNTLYVLDLSRPGAPLK